MERCLIAGVLNCTPDSFSGEGFLEPARAIEAGVAMVEAGADWLDIGGESTRPGARVVPADEEMARVLPVIEGLARALGARAVLSVDTYKAVTARAAIGAGATVVNDVSGGLLDPELLPVVAASGATVVLGHLRGEPATMMEQVAFGDVVAEVTAELEERVAAAREAGCARIWADPGIGFGKRIEHNLELLGALPELVSALGAMDVPLMLGVSRKAFLGHLTGKPAGERQFGTAAAVTACVLGGAAAVRVHDVAQMRDVVAVAHAIGAARADRNFRLAQVPVRPSRQI
jgi:dihydropteroate synthase